MITDVVIEDYQAVKKAEIHLGGMTVITGPTGSGKSAIIRAIRLVPENARGASFVRHGASTARVMVGVREEGLAVAIQRGKKNSYRIVTLDPQTGEPAVKDLTKLGGAVPQEVSDLLRLSEINFAGQFDSPYLLTVSGSEVARKLGELTNVSLLITAGAEGNRRRLRVAQDLAREQERLAALNEELQGYQGLQAQRDAVIAAEKAVQEVTELDRRRTALAGLALSLEKRQKDVAATEALIAEAPVPSLDALDALDARRASLALLVLALRKAEAEQAQAALKAQESVSDELAYTNEYNEALVAAGQCPTCGQEVNGFSQLAVKLFGKPQFGGRT